MASNSSVLTDDSLLSKLDQRLYKLESFFALLSGLAVFSLMILAVISVTGRHSINQPLPGYVDWIEQAMPLIAFMGVAYTQRDGGHIRMDILVSFLKGRSLWIVEFITAFLMLAVMLLIIWGSWAHFGRSFDFNAPMWSRDSSMDIALPLWPAKLLAPVAFSVLALRLALQLVAYARAFIENTDSPVAVPLIEDAATQAAKEADTVSG
ncbi:TRAP transporter small permease [Amylibacter sp. SFDW26]|uniref:TRAP transporter small permease subunit n=1 Tax=Amylibacter sp. SFDW26 TaxID=2652722 RepID=UPI0012619BD7|nr:TRAP transporter small permease [Amylibacter sp. SFDW26]KAB7615997.1 TRAP transporter small permease [Amylibacter sp. SFDW26]